MKTRPLVAVVGPTASGKSGLAMDIARSYNGEIICADSRTVYKGMDIGTAKPSKREQTEIPHHLLDILEPGESFSAAAFKQHANQVIKSISSKGKLPIMVGGTGLYVDAILFDYSFGPEADKDRRAELAGLCLEELHDYCYKYNIILPANRENKRHIIRAIELGGLKSEEKVLRKDTIVVGISTNKDELRARVEKRAHQMVEQGILQEIEGLVKRYGWNSEAMTGNIYRIFRGVIEGEKSLDSALQEVVCSDLHLAKRQITWLKRNPHIYWGQPGVLKSVVHNFLVQCGYIGS